MLSRKVLLSWWLKLRRVLLSLANHYPIASVEKTTIMKMCICFHKIEMCFPRSNTPLLLKFAMYFNMLTILSIFLLFCFLIFFFVFCFLYFVFCIFYLFLLFLLLCFTNGYFPQLQITEIQFRSRTLKYIHDHVLSFYHFGLFRV